MGEGEIGEIASEGAAGSGMGGAQAGVVGFGGRDDVLDVGLAKAREALAVVGAVEGTEALGDLGFYGLRVGVVVAVVGGAALLGGDGKAAPGGDDLGLRGLGLVLRPGDGVRGARVGGAREGCEDDVKNCTDGLLVHGFLLGRGVSEVCFPIVRRCGVRDEKRARTRVRRCRRWAVCRFARGCARGWEKGKRGN